MDQHPGSSAQVNTGGTPPPASIAADGDSCIRGNVDIDFDQIQGNIFGGFNKDYQANLLLKITDPARARLTLRRQNEDGDDEQDRLYTHVVKSASDSVLIFNSQFRALRAAGEPEGKIKTTWTNIVFTAAGLQQIIPDDQKADVAKLPDAFLGKNDKGDFLGMAGRVDLIGDKDVIDPATGQKVVANSPAHWNDGMDVSVDWASAHILVLVASDDPDQVSRINEDGRLAGYLRAISVDDSGLEVLGLIMGQTRMDAGPDQVGHEHFGFKDGVSQPGVRGVDAPADPLHNPEQGDPGQDLLHPGEFVLGYPMQKDTAEKLPSGKFFDGPNRCQGDDSLGGLPIWARNGSFLVFRRLAQDVPGFRASVQQKAAALGLTVDLMGAKIVGRYASGAPLAPLKFQAGTGEFKVPLTDPGVDNPLLANSNALNNDFEYDGDDDGDFVPQSAHIRKAYPRDQVPDVQKDDPQDAESATQTHRLLRRGIPFGGSYGAAVGGGNDDPRGLLFFCYQSSIENQFEFVQTKWVNAPNFPQPRSGQDPLITNDTPAGPIKGCPFHAGADVSKCPTLTFQHFVKTRGGGYFFSPSIDILGDWLSTPAAAGSKT